MNTNIILSPRLRHLQKNLEDGNIDALQSFWDEMVNVGGPLIEEIADDHDHSLVSFLWRSNETESIDLISLLTNPTTYPMTRIPDTDLFYTTCRVRNDIRATYQFSPVDENQPTQEDEAYGARWVNWRPDPLNPHTFAFFDEEEEREDRPGVRLVRSVLEMPDAIPQPWIQEQSREERGRVEDHRIRSKILGNERGIWVYIPPGYESEGDEPYGLLVLFDGWAYLNLMPTTTILDNLLAAGEIPPVVAVFVDSLDVEVRLRELIFHEPFNDFLIDELMPWIRTHYRATSDPGGIILGGSSAGGIAAAYATLEHPEAFGCVLSQSGALRLGLPGQEGYEWLHKQIAEREHLPIKFHLDVGILEENSLRPLGDGPNLLESTRRLRDGLRTKGYEVDYFEFSGGHDYISWQGVLGDALIALLGGSDR
ncbi:MAG: DUF3327 domain-containing protein [Anaerolineales bacterium]|nr:DUF3327 domain-containing protein [Anaerolineales bacterium]